MDANDRVAGRLEVGDTGPVGVIGLEPLEGLGGVVHRGERIDEGLNRRGECGVGADEVGPQRVAAVGGHLLGGEDRRERRRRRERDVGVPAVVVTGPLRPVADAERIVTAVEHEDLGVFVVESALEGVGRGELTEGAAECDLLGRADVLVTKEHDAPAQQRGAQRVDNVRVSGSRRSIPATIAPIEAVSGSTSIGRSVSSIIVSPRRSRRARRGRRRRSADRRGCRRMAAQRPREPEPFVEHDTARVADS